jgi:hypothetical protein
MPEVAPPRTALCRHCEETVAEFEDSWVDGTGNAVCMSRDPGQPVMHLPMPEGFRGAPQLRKGKTVRLWNYWLPVILVRAYRLVPPAVRGHYPFFGAPSSHLALEYLEKGWGWGAVRAAICLSGDSTRPPMPGR